MQWQSDSANDAIYACLNDAKPIGNKGNFGWNNLQHEAATWYHKFNDKWHMSSEAWYMYQKNTPNMSNVDGPALWNSYFGTSNSVGGPFGASGGSGCGPNDGVTCTSKEWAFVNYIIYQLMPRYYFSFRSDILRPWPARDQHAMDERADPPARGARGARAGGEQAHGRPRGWRGWNGQLSRGHFPGMRLP